MVRSTRTTKGRQTALAYMVAGAMAAVILFPPGGDVAWGGGPGCAPFCKEDPPPKRKGSGWLHTYNESTREFIGVPGGPGVTPEYWFKYMKYCHAGSPVCPATPCERDGEQGEIQTLFRAPYGTDNWNFWESTVCVVPSDRTPIEEVTRSVEETVYKKVGKPQAHVEPPGGKVLLNHATIAWTEDLDGGEFTVEQPIPGEAIIKKPEYAWVFSDGNTATDAGRQYDGTNPKEKPGYYVSNVFDEPGEAGVELTTTWRATFSYAGGPPVELDPIILHDGADFTVVESLTVLGN